MPLRLRHLVDVNDGRHVLHAHDRRRGDVRLAKRGVIPAVHDVDVVAALLFRIALKSFQQLRDVALRHLEFVRHRDAVVVVPDRDEHRHLQHARRIDRLPEHPLGTTGVADRAPRDLVAVARELRGRFQLFELAIDLRRVRESDQPRHLRAGRRNVGGGVVGVGLIAERAVGIEQPRREVAVHRAAAGPRIVLDVGMRVQLREEFVERADAGGEDEGLIAVVAAAPVALAERARHGQLRDLFAVAEDAEFGLAGQHFPAADQAGLPRAPGDAVVVDDALARELRADRFGLFRCGHRRREVYPDSRLIFSRLPSLTSTDKSVCRENRRRKEAPFCKPSRYDGFE